MRVYLVAGRPHGDGVPVSGPGICQEPRNPLVGNPALRALLAALDAWAADGVEPPGSMVPRVGDGTLVGPARQEVGFRRFQAFPTSGEYTKATSWTSDRKQARAY